MKLIYSNGRVLTARDVGPPLIILRARAVPLPIVPHVIESEDAARMRLIELLRTGLYMRMENLSK